MAQIRLGQRKVREDLGGRFQNALFAKHAIESALRRLVGSEGVPVIADRRLGEDHIKQHRVTDDPERDARAREGVIEHLLDALSVIVHHLISTRPREHLEGGEAGHGGQWIPGEGAHLHQPLCAGL